MRTRWRATRLAAPNRTADGGVWAASAAGRASPPYYSNAATNLLMMSLGAVATAGGNQPHNNRSPCLGLHFVIALQGIYPPRG